MKTNKLFATLSAVMLMFSMSVTSASAITPTKQTSVATQLSSTVSLTTPKFEVDYPQDNNITLVWGKVKNASGYRIYKYDSKNKKWVTLKTISNSSLKIDPYTKKPMYVVLNLKSATTYKFKVKAYAKVNGETIWSSASKALDTMTGLPATTISVSNVSSTSQKVKCTPLYPDGCKSSNCPHYKVYYEYYARPSYSDRYSLCYKGTASTKTITALNKNTKYYFMVRVNLYNKSTNFEAFGRNSNVVSRTTPNS